jgi:hypothetical protein
MLAALKVQAALVAVALAFKEQAAFLARLTQVGAAVAVAVELETLAQAATAAPVS